MDKMKELKNKYNYVHSKYAVCLEIYNFIDEDKIKDKLEYWKNQLDLLDEKIWELKLERESKKMQDEVEKEIEKEIKKSVKEYELCY